MGRNLEIDMWDLGAKVTELWATGSRGRAVARAIMPDVEAACARLKQKAPNLQALTVKVDRYMASDPGDRRTKQAKNQEKAKEIEVQAVGKIMAAQVDAVQILQRYVRRIDTEVVRIETVMTVHPLTGQPVAPDFSEYYKALSSMSKEMRGWITLLVDIKDRVHQHEQFNGALETILEVIGVECSPEVFLRIMTRLKTDPAVKAVLDAYGGAS